MHCRLIGLQMHAVQSGCKAGASEGLEQCSQGIRIVTKKPTQLSIDMFRTEIEKEYDRNFFPFQSICEAYSLGCLEYGVCH